MGAFQGLAPLLQLLALREMGKQAGQAGWGGRGWSWAQHSHSPGEFSTWLLDSFHPGMGILPVPSPALIL